MAPIRTPLGWDTETALIRPALLAPPLVCITWQRPGLEPRIEVAGNARPLLDSWLRDDSLILVGHNLAYDMAVVGAAFPELMPAIFKAYRDDRCTDTQIRQQLLDIAAGVYRGSVSAKGKRIVYEYTLEALAKRCAGMQLQKDAWRLSYVEFLNVPLDKWPARAREVQAKARLRVVEIEDAIVAAEALGDKPDEALTKERDGLVEMINGDPDRCRTYPLDDARATLAVYQAQEKHASYLHDQYRQARAAFALHLESAWGLRTDGPGVEALRQAVQAEHDELDEWLRAEGLVKEDGVRDTKAAKRRMVEVCTAEGRPVVRTDAHFDGEGKTVADYVKEAEAAAAAKTEARAAAALAAGKRTPKPAVAKVKSRCADLEGSPLDDGHEDCAEHVCLDSDACERSEDELLITYSERSTLGKQLSNDIPALEKGTVYPVHTRFGMAGTGRTTSSKPNIQNQSKRPGYREAFVPRPGYVFAQCDFPGLELYTWAQCCKTWFGHSKLADALNAGMDPHLWVAAIMLGITYEEALRRYEAGDPIVVRARQQAKPGNFGFAGGMGVPKFVATTRKQMGRKTFEELGLTEESARVLKYKWMEAWPESRPAFERAAALCSGADGLGQVESLFTKRYRGRTTYCATCNTPFQGLGADIAKHAAWLIAEAQYVTPSSPLWNTRTVAMVHDEFILEVLDAPAAHDAAMELARLMVVAANEYLPDVPIPLSKMQPCLMRRWSKRAKPLFVDGRLVPWSP